MKKANCGERACIFEDMAKRTELNYRHVAIDGYITSDNRDNHAWSEVFIENEGWVIADSGFDISASNDFSVFHNKYDWLLGPVYTFKNGTQQEDRTKYYIPYTEEIRIKSVCEGNIVPNCTIDIEIDNGIEHMKVIGSNIMLTTNQSGLCLVTLGVYNNTSYNITLRGLNNGFICNGYKKIALGNGSQEIEVEVNNPLNQSYFKELPINSKKHIYPFSIDIFNLLTSHPAS